MTTRLERGKDVSLDFYQIKERPTKNGVVEIYPEFKVCRSHDIMIRGKSFYAIWDENKGLWSTDEYDVQRLIDKELNEYKDTILNTTDSRVLVKSMGNFSSKSWIDYRYYINHVSDNSTQLDEKIIFSNTDVKKKDYVSKKLSYPLEEGSIDAFDEIIGTLYEPDERSKLEWAIGAIVSGDSKSIQKFIVLYGEAGAGKSTILNIIQKLFAGYYTSFEAKALTSSGNSFATEVFKDNPLVAIQHDGDLSKIEDNTRLNSIVSHEEMTMNEKYKPSYTARTNCFLFVGTNKPVKITDAKSGIIRRLIDVNPSGKKISPKRYQALMSQIDFELGAIAYHCLQVYQEKGKNYYALYRPLNMILQTDVFFNFIESNFDVFKEQDGVSLNQAYSMYKEYCDDSVIEFKMPKYKFREEIRNYFRRFDERLRINGEQIRNYYYEFITDKFKSSKPQQEEHQNSLILDSEESIFDDVCSDCLAQYTKIDGTPKNYWSDVKTKLLDLNTRELHYVKVPENHIVIDFDLKDNTGNKSLEKNVEAASKWPKTYAEFSKGGAGIHLHYIYEGDVSKLSRVYSEDIEIKVFTGNSSLRRKLSKCNNIPVTTINSGLPTKGETVINFDAVKNEKGIRTLIKKNLNKESHPGTKPSIDFINKILDDAYASGMHYDVTDMRPAILAFANNSTHQSDYCVKLVGQMKFKSEEISKQCLNETNKFVFFDVEVFPNLFIVNWKYAGAENKCVRMINPKPSDIEPLFKYKLIGFNCRRYDNHILYARYIGYSNEQLYNLSKKIIGDSKNCMFGEAYNISYTDVYDFASAGNKMSLKKWEIKLGIHHQELGLPWDQPVPEDLWIKVAEYCDNDVIATEAVFEHLSGDWTARQILAKLSGLSYNDTTNQHTIKIVFGDDKHPQDQHIYTDLSIMFPGYKFENGKSFYKGEEIGEGGLVRAKPGMYFDVALLDVESMHPNSIKKLNLLGKYTQRYYDLVEGRLAIKHEDIELIKGLLDGKLKEFIDDPQFTLSDLSNGLKTPINAAYGLTSAKFDNPFRDPRNIDNIVAKRGALFMVDLKEFVEASGFIVAHIKTDSIKIPNATPEIIKAVMEFGKKYGYNFEHEATYKKMTLVNDAVYIAKYADQETCKTLYGYVPKNNKKHPDEWTATGAQFAQPYVFKTLFSKEPILFEDMCETKSVTSAMFLDMNENIGEVHNYQFIGKVGSFCPILPGKGGGVLLREKDGKYYAVSGSKGYRWLEAEMVQTLNKQNDIDKSYYVSLVNDAVASISKYGDFKSFVDDYPPWLMPCGEDRHGCYDCPNMIKGQSKCKKGYDLIPF